MNIIGQKTLINNIDNLIEHNNLPRYIIIQGPMGSGKKLLADYIAKKLNALLVPSDLSVDSVREVIELAYQQTEDMVYLWGDADKMSVSAKNAVLKITEEAPQKAYFIMTTVNTSLLLNTLISRAYVIDMQPYTVDDLIEFAQYKFSDLTDKVLNTMIDLSSTPGDMINLSDVDIAYLNKITDILCKSVGSNNLANELKITTFLRFKSEDKDKIEPLLFMQTCMLKFSELMLENYDLRYADLITLTNKYMADIDSKSLNRQSVVDNWIIDMHTLVAGGV